ncbi:hypothetical protein R5R35_012947 [Gryllus longicercus]|uniref:Complementary sex determination N-terminal domain-containing protein n=1 Tax=Gryllus longicercus TaxID=2509291 RepID=A0AAN9W662_9ORTH
MKSAAARSPSRRSSPPPPHRMSRRSPNFRRGRTPERRRRVDSQSSRMSPPRSRERREFRSSPRSQPPPEFAVPRRSRSPIRESKRRSFSPKRKSPKRERREPERERSARPAMSRKRSRSKSPPVVVGPPLHESTSRLGPYSGPSEGPPGRFPGPDTYTSPEPIIEIQHSGRSISGLSERFAEASRGSYEEEHPDRPVFRGPDRSTGELEKIPVDGHSDRPFFRGPDGAGFDINELKKITMSIKQTCSTNPTRVTRNIIRPEDVVLVRRIETSLDGEYTSSERSHHVSRDGYGHENRSPSPKSRRRLSPWEQDPMNLNHRRIKNEGKRPIFEREEIIQGNQRSKYDPGPSSHRLEEHQRIVAVISNPPHTQTSGGPRYESPGRHSSSHAPTTYYGGDREHRGSSRDYVRSRDYERSHGPGSGFEPRDKSRDDHFERREDLRHDLESRRRDEPRYISHGEGMRSYDKGRDYRESERGSDLRMRIHDKRSDRHEDHEMGRHHSMERHELERERDRDRERERERRPMMQPSPPGDRRRGPMEYRHMGDGDRKMRGDMHMGPGSHGPGGRRYEGSDRFHQEPEFGPRPDRFHGSKPWDMNPEYVPKGRAYFEHDNRDEMRMPTRGRGNMGMRGQFRGRGMMRGRIFRGVGQSRGYMGGRGTGRRGGYLPRYKRSSPHWEHDLFDNTSPSHGNNEFSK